MSEFARHLIGVLSAGMLGLIASGLLLWFVVAAFIAAFRDGIPEAKFLVCVMVVMALGAGAAWGLQ